jgi:N-acetylglucosaminyl-diphospho-decaprenol L-rhamnosyltransferase
VKPVSGSVDAVIPTFNAAELLRRCLERLDDPAVARVIVVDDVSTDGTREVAESFGSRVSLVRLSEHRGLAHALNRGVTQGDAEFVLFLNNDVFARPGAIGRLVDALRADPEAASAGGRLVDPGTDRTQDSYLPRALPELTGVCVRVVGVERFWKRNPWTGQHLRRPLDLHRTTRVDRQPAGACLLVRRAALAAIGGWDERYWIWYEDVDLSRRLAQVGYALYVPDAVFEHVGGASTGHYPRAEQHRRLYHGTMRYGEAYFSRSRRAALGLVVMAVSLPRIAYFSLRDREAASVYRQIFRGGLALVRGRPVPSLMGPGR